MATQYGQGRVSAQAHLSAAPPREQIDPVGALAQGILPTDIYQESRNRLPSAEPGAPLGADGIRLHASGLSVRWEWPLGRALTELAILITAREHDQPFEWSLHELEGIAVGLDPRVIDSVRNRASLSGLDEEESIIVQMGDILCSKARPPGKIYCAKAPGLGSDSDANPRGSPGGGW